MEDTLQEPEAPKETGLQDGMLEYYNQATKLTDWYGTQEYNRTHSDFRDFLKRKD